MANYSEDEITKIAVILEYVALDFFNRFMDVALAKWVRTTAYRLFAIIYKTFPLCLKKWTRKIQTTVILFWKFNTQLIL